MGIRKDLIKAEEYLWISALQGHPLAEQKHALVAYLAANLNEVGNYAEALRLAASPEDLLALSYMDERKKWHVMANFSNSIRKSGNHVIAAEAGYTPAVLERQAVEGDSDSAFKLYHLHSYGETTYELPPNKDKALVYLKMACAFDNLAAWEEMISLEKVDLSTNETMRKKMAELTEKEQIKFDVHNKLDPHIARIATEPTALEKVYLATHVGLAQMAENAFFSLFYDDNRSNAEIAFRKKTLQQEALQECAALSHRYSEKTSPEGVQKSSVITVEEVQSTDPQKVIIETKDEKEQLPFGNEEDQSALISNNGNNPMKKVNTGSRKLEPHWIDDENEGL